MSRHRANLADSIDPMGAINTAGPLPAPLVPAEVDLRGTPIPLDVFVELAMQSFGIDQKTAEAMVREAAAHSGVQVEDVGHA